MIGFHTMPRQQRVEVTGKKEGGCVVSGGGGKGWVKVRGQEEGGVR